MFFTKELTKKREFLLTAMARDYQVAGHSFGYYRLFI